MDIDPFESIIKECQKSSSQENKLRNCRFAFEPEEEESSPPCSVQATGIVMLSLPESSNDDQEKQEDKDVFHTPPEHHISENQGPETRPVQKDFGCFEDTFDLGKDCDYSLGFSEPQFEGGPDLIKKIETFMNEMKKNKVSGCDLESRSRNDCLGDTEPTVIESCQDVNIGETEVVDLADDCNEIGDRAENVDEAVKVGNIGESSSSKNVEDLDALKYVSSVHIDKGGGVLGKRELPNSFKDQEENEGLWVPRQSLKDKEMTFKDVLNDVGEIVDNAVDTDYIKMAKERGLTFYQPRWLPQGEKGGLADHIMD